MPYEITIEDHFAAAHYLRGYRGKCENVHGHNFRVEVTCKAETLDETGIALDFKDLKCVLGSIIAKLDHTNLNDFAGLDGHNPTAENLARYVYHEINRLLADSPAAATKVTVYESDKYRASYYE